MCSSPNDSHGERIVDITAAIGASLPAWLSETGLGEGTARNVVNACWRRCERV